MTLRCNMKEYLTIMYFKIVFVTLVGVNNSGNSMVKTRIG